MQIVIYIIIIIIINEQIIVPGMVLELQAQVLCMIFPSIYIGL